MDSLSRKRSYSDMKSPLPYSKLIDEHVYCTTVLHLAPSLTEDDLDEQAQLESRTLGLPPPQVSNNIEVVISSLSATTISSGSIKQDSLLSQSTAPTSCSSSEYRPMTQSSIWSGNSGQISQKPSTMSETQTKSSLGFRNGFRNKMAGLKRKKSPTSMSIASTIVVSPENDKVSLKSGMQSPGSAKSSKSSWSHPVSLAKSSYESAAPIDAEAMRRSTDCLEMISLKKLQMEERSRFLEFERCLLAELRTRRDSTKEEKCRGHSIISDEKQSKVSLRVLEGLSHADGV
jgi:hypothetical protein